MSEKIESQSWNQTNNTAPKNTEELVLKAISDWKLTKEEANEILTRFREEKAKVDEKYNWLKLWITQETAQKLFKMSNEFWFSDLSNVIKENVQVNEDLKETSLSYFWISWVEFRQVQDFFEEYWLEFDFKWFLDGYKEYIDKNFAWLDKDIIEKVKLSIRIKFFELKKVLEEKIKFVDMQIQEWDYKKEDRLKEIRNERWNINSGIQEAFWLINNTILPSWALLWKIERWEKVDKRSSMQIWTRAWYYNSLDGEIEQARKMFGTEVNEKWDFENSLLRPSFTPNRLIDFKREYDKNVWEDNNIWFWEIPSILTEEDKKIESKAKMAFYAAIWMQLLIELWPAVYWNLVPGVWGIIWTIGWAIVWGTVDLYDTFSDTEALLDMVQWMWLADKNYRMDKTLLDNILAWIWLVPWMTWAIKWAKLAKFISTLKPWELDLFNKTFSEIWNNLMDSFKVADRVEKAEAKTWISRHIVFENSKWVERWDFDLPNKILREKWLSELTPEQLEVVKKVHKETSKWIYQNEYSDLKKMTKELKDAWIDKDQIRALMENWITWEAKSWLDLKFKWRQEIPEATLSKLTEALSNWEKITIWNSKATIEISKSHRWEIIVESIIKNWERIHLEDDNRLLMVQDEIIDMKLWFVVQDMRGWKIRIINRTDETDSLSITSVSNKTPEQLAKEKNDLVFWSEDLKWSFNWIEHNLSQWNINWAVEDFVYWCQKIDKEHIVEFIERISKVRGVNSEFIKVLKTIDENIKKLWEMWEANSNRLLERILSVKFFNNNNLDKNYLSLLYAYKALWKNVDQILKRLTLKPENMPLWWSKFIDDFIKEIAEISWKFPYWDISNLSKIKVEKPEDLAHFYYKSPDWSIKKLSEEDLKTLVSSIDWDLKRVEEYLSKFIPKEHLIELRLSDIYNSIRQWNISDVTQKLNSTQISWPLNLKTELGKIFWDVEPSFSQFKEIIDFCISRDFKVDNLTQWFSNKLKKLSPTETNELLDHLYTLFPNNKDVVVNVLSNIPNLPKDKISNFRLDISDFDDSSILNSVLRNPILAKEYFPNLPIDKKVDLLLNPEFSARFDRNNPQDNQLIDRVLFFAENDLIDPKRLESLKKLISRMDKAEAKSKVPREQVIANSKWVENWDFDLPNKVLEANGKPPLDSTQLEWVKKIHLEISQWLYQNEVWDLRKMVKAMDELWISREQWRVLMENWVTWVSWDALKIIDEINYKWVYGYLESLPVWTRISSEQLAWVIFKDFSGLNSVKEVDSLLSKCDNDIDRWNIPEIFSEARNLAFDFKLADLKNDPKTIKIDDLLLFEKNEKFEELLSTFFTNWDKQEVLKFLLKYLDSWIGIWWIKFHDISEANLESLLEFCKNNYMWMPFDIPNILSKIVDRIATWNIWNIEIVKNFITINPKILWDYNQSNIQKLEKLLADRTIITRDNFIEYLDNIRENRNLTQDELSVVISTNINKFSDINELRNYLWKFNNIKIDNLDSIFESSLEKSKDILSAFFRENPDKISVDDLVLFKWNKNFDELFWNFVLNWNQEELNKLFRNVLSWDFDLNLSKLPQETIKSILDLAKNDSFDFGVFRQIFMKLINETTDAWNAKLIKEFLSENKGKFSISDQELNRLLIKLDIVISPKDPMTRINWFLEWFNIEEYSKILSDKNDATRTVWNLLFEKNLDLQFKMINKWKPEFFSPENIWNFFWHYYRNLPDAQKWLLYDLVKEWWPYYEPVKDFSTYQEILKEFRFYYEESMRNR